MIMVKSNALAREEKAGRIGTKTPTGLLFCPGSALYTTGYDDTRSYAAVQHGRAQNRL